VNLPNCLTIARVILIPIFLFFLFVRFAPEPIGHYLAAFIFIFAALTDGLDGYLARSRKQVSRFGRFMDPIADKLLVTAALVSLVALGDVGPLPVIIILGREFAVSGLRSLAAAEGIEIAATKWGKVKTITQVVAISVILLNNFPFSLFNFPFDRIALWFAVFVTIYSGFDYFLHFRYLLTHESNP